MNWQKIIEEFLVRVVQYQLLILIGVAVFGGKWIYERKRKNV